MKRLLLYAIISFFLYGCGMNPYQQGIKLAEEYDKCLSAYYDALEQAGENFADRLPGKYDSRAKAINDYMALLCECHDEYLKQWNALENKESKVRKSVKSTADLSEFDSGLSTRDMRVFASEPCLETVEISPAVLKQVRQINPPKPDEVQMTADLVGHTLSEGKENGYYPQSWKWKILENGVSNLKITNVQESSSTRYVVTVSMRVSSDTRAYDAKALVSYVLGDISDWQIEFVQSQGLDIVKTHRYDDCVKCYITRSLIGRGLDAENNCEIALEVAGRELNCLGEWVTFCRIVPPHQSTRISYNDTDFRVDYIERP